MLYWKKGESKPLSKHFNSAEFSCHCTHPSCQTQIIDEDLLAKLDAVRDELGEPVVITSGHRCDAYQADLRAQGYETAKGISQHELGKAADVHADPAHMPQLIELTRKHFKARGIAHTFVHVDLRCDKEREWFYYKR